MSDIRDSAGDDAGRTSAAILDRLFRSEWPRLTRYVRRSVGNSDDASDLVQEAFANFAKARPSSLDGCPEAYLQRVVRNTLINWLKRRRARRTDFHVPIEDSHHPSTDPEQSWRIEAGEMMAQYRLALGELPDRTREVFLLHRVEELTYGEIACRLSLSVKTIEYHMARALAHLDKALNGE